MASLWATSLCLTGRDVISLNHTAQLDVLQLNIWGTFKATRSQKATLNRSCLPNIHVYALRSCLTAINLNKLDRISNKQRRKVETLSTQLCGHTFHITHAISEVCCVHIKHTSRIHKKPHMHLSKCVLYPRWHYITCEINAI